MLVCMRKPVCKLWNLPQEIEEHPDEWGMSQKETCQGPGVWKGGTEVCGARERSKRGELLEKGPMKEVVTSQKGKAVLLSPPTLAPVGFSHFCTHDQSFATGWAFSSFSMSQLWLRLEGVCAHSETLHTCWKTLCQPNRIKCNVSFWWNPKHRMHNLLWNITDAHNSAGFSPAQAANVLKARQWMPQTDH